MTKQKMYEVKDFTGRWCLARGEELAGDTLSYELIKEPGQKGIVGSALWREVIEGTEFTCPQCGSHAFGSHAVGTDQWKGICHGYRTVQRFTGRHQTNPTEACGFTWPRSDDEKYFKGTGHFSPALCTAQVVKQA